MFFHRAVLGKIAARGVHWNGTEEENETARSTGGSGSLFRVKILLTSIRLASQPPAFILDEPDWGLTRDHATAFVLSVIETAHENGIPVILISHKPWWRQIVRSTLHVHKTSACSASKRLETPAAFRIAIEPEKSRKP